jgi:dTDP-4-dehydrorhamnose reductase
VPTNRGPAAGPVLVLGGSGFLGVHVVELATARDLPRGGEVVSVARSRHAVPPGARSELADALAERRLEVLLDRVAPRAVLLAAALARTGECARAPERALELNARLPGRVARWCSAAGTRLVHVSTDLVFGATDAPAGGFGEDHPTGPVSVYGASKVEGELAVAAEHPGALVARLPLLYGDSRGRGLGASDSLLAAVARGERPGLFTDEWRTPLDVRSAARALVELLLRPDAPAGILHVAGADRVQRHELGLAVLRAAGRSEEQARAAVRATTRAAAGDAASRPRDVSLDCARARAFLTAPLPGLADGLRPPPR